PLAAAVPLSNQWIGPGAELIRQSGTGMPLTPDEQRDQQAQAAAEAIGKKIELTAVERLTAHEVPFLKQHAGGPFKVTLPGAGQFAATAFRPGVTDTVYSSREEFASDVAAVVRREIMALIDEGVPYIQLDSLRYVTQIADPTRRQAMIDAGQDPESELDFTIKVDN